MNVRTSTVKYMSRLTRLPARLNSSGSQIFIIITPNLRPNLTLRFLSGKSPISSQISLNFRPPHKSISPISPPKFHKFTTSTIPADCRKPHPHATAMDSNTAPPPPDSDNTLVVEDSVHVDNASPEPHFRRNLVVEDSNTASFPLESDNSPVVEDTVHVDNASPDPNLEYSSVEGVDQLRSEDVYANGEGVDQVRSEDVYANGEGVYQLRSEDVYANGEGVDQVRSEDVYVNGEGEVEDLNQRKVLPEELSRGVMVLSCESTAEGGVCDVFLVGTAHVSQDSCVEVQAVISYLKPQVVFLELCSSRVAVLTPQSLKVPTMREMVEMLKKKQNAFGILYSWFLAKVATKLEVFPGSEFRVAFEEAKKYGGKVILGDRPVNITLRRTWGKMPLWHKTKLMYNLLFQALFLPSSEDLNRMLKEMDDSDMLTLVIQEMSKEFPTLMETLVHERDQYMSSTLLRVASEHSSVVAVIGKGHLQGIKKHWQQPIEMKDLMQMPPQKPAVSTVKVIASLGVAAAGVAIISGIYLSSKK